LQTIEKLNGNEYIINQNNYFMFNTHISAKQKWKDTLLNCTGILIDYSIIIMEKKYEKSFEPSANKIHEVSSKNLSSGKFFEFSLWHNWHQSSRIV